MRESAKRLRPDEEANRRKGPQQLFPTVYNSIGLRYATGHHDGNSPHYLHQRPPHFSAPHLFIGGENGLWM